MSEKKRRLLIGGIVVLIYISLYFFAILPGRKQFKLSNSETTAKALILRNFFARPEGPPAKREISAADAEIAILREKYRDIEAAFISEPKEEPALTPVEFGKVLHETKKKLFREAEDSGLNIPPELGFKETIPAAEEVAPMTKQLEAIVFIIKEAIPFKFGDIKNITYHGIERDAEWEKTGIELDIYGEFGRVMDFLYYLTQRETIYTVKSLDIKRREIKKSGIKMTPRLRPAPSKPESEEDLGEKRENIPGEGFILLKVNLLRYDYIRAHGH